MNIFGILVWGGAALTVAGLALLGWCIVTVARLRKSGAEQAEFQARMQRIVAVNMAALMVSALGLICVVTGIILA